MDLQICIWRSILRDSDASGQMNHALENMSMVYIAAN